MTLNKKVVNISEAKRIRERKSLIAELQIYKEKSRSGYNYRLNKGRELNVCDDTILHCFSQVFGDMLSYNDNPETIHEAIESLVERFIGDDGEVL